MNKNSLKLRLGMILESFSFKSSKPRQVIHRDVKMSFFTPNSLVNYRINTFSTKEPDTLAWIDAFEPDSIFYDIGANIGLYSIYAAKSKNSKVFSFEPSVFNLENFSRNVNVNGLEDNICIIPIPLNNKDEICTLTSPGTQAGGANNSIADFGYDGQPILKTTHSYKTISLKLSTFAFALGLPNPDYIKIDVDGIELLILEGFGGILGHCKELLIEINDDFKLQNQGVNSILTSAGFVLNSKFLAEQNSNCFNQLWIRK